jgi:hypothetical protein
MDCGLDCEDPEHLQLVKPVLCSPFLVPGLVLVRTLVWVTGSSTDTDLSEALESEAQAASYELVTEEV